MPNENEIRLTANATMQAVMESIREQAMAQTSRSMSSLMDRYMLEYMTSFGTPPTMLNPMPQAINNTQPRIVWPTSSLPVNPLEPQNVEIQVTLPITATDTDDNYQNELVVLEERNSTKHLQNELEGKLKSARSSVILIKEIMDELIFTANAIVGDLRTTISELEVAAANAPGNSKESSDKSSERNISLQL